MPTLRKNKIKKNEKSDTLGLQVSVVLLSFLQMREIDQKIKKLEASIILSPTIHSLDPVRNHRIKVNLFNKAKQELLKKSSLKSEI